MKICDLFFYFDIEQNLHEISFRLQYRFGEKFITHFITNIWINKILSFFEQQKNNSFYTDLSSLSLFFWNKFYKSQNAMLFPLFIRPESNPVTPILVEISIKLDITKAIFKVFLHIKRSQRRQFAKMNKLNRFIKVTSYL